ncbi:MAG: aldose 1-epimerase [Rhodospirillales bacterium]|nr:aldose 1-epimerase [Rhodospirillales bacterium]
MQAASQVTSGIDRVRLRAGDSALDLHPEIGGAIGAFWSEIAGHRIDWLRPASDRAVAEGDVEGMACFPLVPFSNRVRAGRFEFDGIAAFVPPSPGPHAEHGHGWRRPWRTVRRTPEQATIEFEMRAPDWPFPYRARQSFELASRRLCVELSVENLSTRAMPLGVGLHPYFPCTPRCRLQASVSGMWTIDPEVMPVDLVEPPPAHADLRNGIAPAGIELDNCFPGWDGEARIEWPEHGAFLSMRSRAPQRFLVVYSPKGEGYFCAEPVSNCTDAFNLASAGRTDTGIVRLLGGRTITTTTIFEAGINGGKT